MLSVMILTDEKIARINTLARKARSEGLTEDEKAEQAKLRKEYIDSMKRSLEMQLNSIVVEEKDGTRHKLEKKQ